MVLQCLRGEAQGTAETSRAQTVDRIEFYLDNTGKHQEEGDLFLSSTHCVSIMSLFLPVRPPSVSFTGRMTIWNAPRWPKVSLHLKVLSHVPRLCSLIRSRCLVPEVRISNPQDHAIGQ